MKAQLKEAKEKRTWLKGERNGTFSYVGFSTVIGGLSSLLDYRCRARACCGDKSSKPTKETSFIEQLVCTNWRPFNSGANRKLSYILPPIY